MASKALAGLVEWEGRRGGRLVVGDPRAIGALAGAMVVGAAAFWGAGGIAILGGGSATGSASSFVYGAPNKPTIDAVVFAATGDSVRLLGSAFIGSGDAAHDSTQFAVDTIDGDWSGLDFSSSLAAVLTDTATGLDSAGHYKARVRYKADPNKGGWSAWSDSVDFEMVSSSGDFWFFSNWDEGADSAGTNSTILTDGGKWDGVSAGPLPRILRVVEGADMCGGGAPTDHVFTITETGGGDNHLILDIPFFVDGTDFRMRAFLCADFTITSNGSHSPSVPNSSPFCWAGVLRGGSGEWAWALFEGPEGEDTSRWNTPVYPLSPNTWYRLEVYFHFVDADEHQSWIFVYDMAGNVVYDSGDLYNEGNPSNSTLEEAYNANNNVVISGGRAHCDALYWGMGEDDFGLAAFGSGHSLAMTAFAIDTIQPDQPIGDVIP